MAKTVLRNCLIEIDDVELSARASSVTITSEYDVLDSTTFGPGGFKESELGMRSASIQVDFFQDFEAASVDATLWPLHDGAEVFEVKVKSVNATTGVTNPDYVMAESILPSYTPLAGNVGEMSKTQVTFQNNGQTGIQRYTNPAS